MLPLAKTHLSKQKRLLLLGAGTSHLKFVMEWMKSGHPDASITWVSEVERHYYSAKVPSYLAREVSLSEITIDLPMLASRAEIGFIRGKVERIEPQAEEVSIESRPPLIYDLLSINLGANSFQPAMVNGLPNVFVMRPLHALIQNLDRLDSLLLNQRQARLCVVGAGASGCEISLALQERYVGHPIDVVILNAHSEVVLDLSRPSQKRMVSTLKRKRIRVIQGAVQRIDARSVYFSDGTSLHYDAVILATHTTAPPLFRVCGLSVNQEGFLQVGQTLQVRNYPNIFASGDCVSFETEIPKNGVMAVKQGRTLHRNLYASLTGQKLVSFRVPRKHISLLSTNERAILDYGAFGFEARWLKALKDLIDRRWLRRFGRSHEGANGVPRSNHQIFALKAVSRQPLPIASHMKCGGCASKVSSDILHRVLKRLDIPPHPRVLVGVAEAEDASVYEIDSSKMQVHSVDFFRSFIKDPYLLGQIAANNALSDLYAMNASPHHALAMVVLPFGRLKVQEGLLYELLAGSLKTFKEHGVVLAGGHTSEASELGIGFSVVGEADRSALFLKRALAPGDRLILTKRLGTGALLAALSQGKCRGEWLREIIDGMLVSNAAARKILHKASVKACTDVTGFGLAGHLSEMLLQSRVSACLNRQSVPVYNGFNSVIEEGIFSSLHPENQKFQKYVSDLGWEEPSLYDPQTAGGLLFGVSLTKEKEVLEALRAAGYTYSSVIGEVYPCNQGELPIRFIN